METLFEKIFDKTLASEIESVKPSEEPSEKITWYGTATKEQTDEIEKSIREWEEWEMKRKKDESREVSESDIQRVLEIMRQTREWLGKMDVYWTMGGKIAVSTPRSWWMSLCGREWHVDLENGEYACVAMS